LTSAPFIDVAFPGGVLSTALEQSYLPVIPYFIHSLTPTSFPEENGTKVALYKLIDLRAKFPTCLGFCPKRVKKRRAHRQEDYNYMDIATILGVISAFGLVFAAIFMGGGVNLFINVPAMMIVVGGTLGATMINYPLGDVFGVFKVVKKALFSRNISISELIRNFVDFAQKSRKEGILALEGEIKNVKDAFFRKGVQLSIDGLEPEEISTILETEIDFIRSRHQLGAEIFTTMGTFSPALGMIGTLVGLVQMLQRLDDPSAIGPSMAVALLTTFYGSLMANIVCLPIAGKLRTRSKEEVLTKEMTIQGIISISNGDNPRILEQKLLAFIPSNKRESIGGHG
jgi:chemotaxis protein MotA